MNRPEFQDLLRISDADRRRILDRADIAGSEASAQRTDKRREPRWSYRDRSIAVVVEHPAGGVSRYLASPRNISAGGICFLHGGFLHRQSKCRIDLVTLDHRVVRANGKVVSCRLIEGRIHEIGVQFDKPLDPSAFVASLGSAMPGDPAATSNLAIELPRLNGDLLCIDDSDADMQLLHHQLRSTGVELAAARTPTEAKRLLREKQFDMVMCDFNLDGYDGVELIKSIRAHGFSGPIALLTDDAGGSHSAAAKLAGANLVLRKPFTPAELLEVLTTMHREAANAPKAASATPAAGAASDHQVRRRAS